MVLVYINNKSLSSKIITYLEDNNIKVTTNFEDKYDNIIISDISKKTLEFIKKDINRICKISIILYDLEDSIYKKIQEKNKKSKLFFINLIDALKNCDTIYVSLPYFKEILKTSLPNKKIIVLEKEIPNIYRIDSKRKSNKTIFFDPNYENLDILFDLIKEKKEIVLIGFVPFYLLNKKQKKLLIDIERHVEIIKYYNEYIYTYLCKTSNFIVFCSDDVNNYKFLDIAFILKKRVIIKNDILYTNYLINSKNCYLFSDSKELILKIKKIQVNRFCDMTLESYDLIKDNTIKKIGVKLSKNFK